MTIKPSTKRKIVRWFLSGKSVFDIGTELMHQDKIVLSDMRIEDIIRKAAIRQEKKK